MSERKEPGPILFVNGYVDTTRMLRHLLSYAAYELDEATTIAKAKERLSARRYALMLCRYQIADGYGQEIIDYAWERHRTPSVAITGTLSKEQMASLVTQPDGLRGVLSFPFHIHEFTEMLASALGDPYVRTVFEPVTCPECRGTGEILLLIKREHCLRCGGTGRLPPRLKSRPAKAHP